MKAALYWTGYIAFCLFALAAGTVTGYIGSNELAQILLREALTPGSQNPLPKDELYILLLGADEQRLPGGKVIEGARGRTDTIQLIRCNFEENSIGMMQIPRDTEVNVPGHGRGKINSVHVFYGPEATADVVAQLTGIRPDKVVVANYDTIRTVVDLLGGVEIDVPRDMKYRDRRGDLEINLKKGLQLLNGEQVVGFLRYRHDSDFFRGERQQLFLDALRRRIAQKKLNLADLDRLSRQVTKLVTGNMTREEIVYLGLWAKSVPVENVKSGRLPVREGRSTNLLPIPEELEQALVESGMKDPPPAAESATGSESSS
jgi:LCP family protein required for cell wall assembly